MTLAEIPKSPLRRLGNKRRLLPKLLPLFPEHITTFIDLFMGTGTVTFAMADRAKYLFANDKDQEVFNLFMVLKERREELIQAIEMMPVHEALWKYWKTQEETDPVWRAVRFLFFSNFGAYGQPISLRITAREATKLRLLKACKQPCLFLNVQFIACDFRRVLPRINWQKKDFGRPVNPKTEAFIYADPPFLSTGNNYQDSFTEQDTRDLFDVLTTSGMRFALSEFRHPLVIDLAKQHGLQVHSLGERQNLKNRREELLITNYDPPGQTNQLSLEQVA